MICEGAAISASPPPIACGESVCVTAGGRRVLLDCSFAFAKGRFTGILGPNGAGKTTLLGLCNGLVRPASGTVRALGEKLTPKNAAALRKRIGYVAQWRVIDPRQPITVFDSVLSGLYGKLGLFRKPGRAERLLAEQAIEAVSVSHLARRPLGHISGGEAQRVAIARALAQEPELLLLDEPTASLDWQARRDILQLVGELRRNLSLTVVMVTHELNALEDLCDDILFMKQGRVLWQGPSADAIDAQKLSELFDAPVEIIPHKGKAVILI